MSPAWPRSGAWSRCGLRSTPTSPSKYTSPTPTGYDLPDYYKQIFDPFLVLTAAAAVTTRLRLATGIALVANHDPITLAKQIATLDQISGGRFMLGVGAGWIREEIENHGVEFETRWRRAVEHLEAMRAIWTQDEAAFAGKWVNFDPPLVVAQARPAAAPADPLRHAGAVAAGDPPRRRLAPAVEQGSRPSCPAGSPSCGPGRPRRGATRPRLEITVFSLERSTTAEPGGGVRRDGRRPRRPPASDRIHQPTFRVPRRVRAAPRSMDPPALSSAPVDPAPKPRRPRRDTVRRRTEIVSAARQVFFERGLAGARTREIAQAAGVNEGVLFRYFSSKEEMFQAAIIDPLEEFFERLLPLEASAINAAPTVESREKLIHQAEREWIEAMEEIVPLLGVALFSDREKGRQFYTQRLFPLIVRATEVAPLSTASWARPGIDSAVLVLSIFGINFAVALDRYFREARDDIGAYIPKIVDQVVYGVSPLPADVAESRARPKRRR